MSLWGVHIGFTAIVTTLLLAGSGLPRARRWSVIAICGAWAIVPDLYHFVPGTRSWFKPLVHDSMLANLFWLHRFIDRIEPGDSLQYSRSMVLLFLLVFLSSEMWIQYVQNGRE